MADQRESLEQTGIGSSSERRSPVNEVVARTLSELNGWGITPPVQLQEALEKSLDAGREHASGVVVQVVPNGLGEPEVNLYYLWKGPVELRRDASAMNEVTHKVVDLTFPFEENFRIRTHFVDPRQTPNVSLLREHLSTKNPGRYRQPVALQY